MRRDRGLALSHDLHVDLETAVRQKLLANAAK